MFNRKLESFVDVRENSYCLYKPLFILCSKRYALNVIRRLNDHYYGAGHHNSISISNHSFVSQNCLMLNDVKVTFRI